MDIFQLKLYCPDLKAQVDVQQIREVLASSTGYSSAEFDIPTHTIIVATANQDGGHAVVRDLSRAGYPPEEVTLIATDELLERQRS